MWRSNYTINYSVPGIDATGIPLRSVARVALCLQIIKVYKVCPCRSRWPFLPQARGREWNEGRATLPSRIHSRISPCRESDIQPSWVVSTISETKLIRWPVLTRWRYFLHPYSLRGCRKSRPREQTTRITALRKENLERSSISTLLARVV